MTISIMALSSPSSFEVSLTSFLFSGGEVSVKLDPAVESSKVSRLKVHADLRNSNDVMELLMTTDALRRVFKDTPIDLVMPYIPYARQDRVCAYGEALSIKVFADLINAQNYASVMVHDCHSEVGLALLDRVTNVKPSTFIGRVPELLQGHILVSPDAGANKKVLEVAKSFTWFDTVIRADKVRNVMTGAITDTVVYCDDLKGQNVLIVDDLLDFGRTFVELAKKLKEKNAGKVYLYVTHALLAGGTEPFHGLIDAIYSPNIWVQSNDPILKVIK